jgi:hypothetical protein
MGLKDGEQENDNLTSFVLALRFSHRNKHCGCNRNFLNSIHVAHVSMSSENSVGLLERDNMRVAYRTWCR